jgi:hypothetical protein
LALDCWRFGWFARAANNSHTPDTLKIKEVILEQPELLKDWCEVDPTFSIRKIKATASLPSRMPPPFSSAC